MTVRYPIRVSTRRALAPLACALCLLVVAGCGGGDDGGAADEPATTGTEGYASHEQALRAFLAREGQERARAVSCSRPRVVVTCVVAFENGSCQGYTVKPGNRAIIRRTGQTNCPTRTETSS